MDRALPRSLQSVLAGTIPGGGLHFLLRRLRRAGVQIDGAEGEAYVLQHRGGRENIVGNRGPRLPIARNGSRRTWRELRRTLARGRAGSLRLVRRRGLSSRSLSIRPTDYTLDGPALAALDGLDRLLSLFLGELANRVSGTQLERPIEDRLLQVGCVLDDARRASHRSTTNTQSGGRLLLSQDVRVRPRTITLGLLRGSWRKQRRLRQR